MQLLFGFMKTEIDSVRCLDDVLLLVKRQIFTFFMLDLTAYFELRLHN